MASAMSWRTKPIVSAAVWVVAACVAASRAQSVDAAGGTEAGRTEGAQGGDGAAAAAQRRQQEGLAGAPPAVTALPSCCLWARGRVRRAWAVPLVSPRAGSACGTRPAPCQPDLIAASAYGVARAWLLRRLVALHGAVRLSSLFVNGGVTLADRLRVEEQDGTLGRGGGARRLMIQVDAPSRWAPAAPRHAGRFEGCADCGAAAPTSMPGSTRSLIQCGFDGGQPALPFLNPGSPCERQRHGLQMRTTGLWISWQSSCAQVHSEVEQLVINQQASLPSRCCSSEGLLAAPCRDGRRQGTAAWTGRRAAGGWQHA